MTASSLGILTAVTAENNDKATAKGVLFSLSFMLDPSAVSPTPPTRAGLQLPETDQILVRVCLRPLCMQIINTSADRALGNAVPVNDSCQGLQRQPTSCQRGSCWLAVVTPHQQQPAEASSRRCCCSRVGLFLTVDRLCSTPPGDFLQQAAWGTDEGEPNFIIMIRMPSSQNEAKVK